MIRTILTPTTHLVSFSIPEDYVGKELEVIVFSKNETLEQDSTDSKKVSFTAISIDTKSFKFNRDEANQR